MMINRLGSMRAYGASNSQQESFAARATKDVETQVRIAKNSDSRLVLLNLALNKNLEAEAVEALFDRELKYVSRRLKSLGYKEKSFLGF